MLTFAIWCVVLAVVDAIVVIRPERQIGAGVLTVRSIMKKACVVLAEAQAPFIESVRFLAPNTPCRCAQVARSHFRFLIFSQLGTPQLIFLKDSSMTTLVRAIKITTLSYVVALLRAKTTVIDDGLRDSQSRFDVAIKREFRNCSS